FPGPREDTVLDSDCAGFGTGARGKLVAFPPASVLVWLDKVGRAGTVARDSGFQRERSRENSQSTNTASDTQATFSASSTRSGIGRFLLLPLLEIQNDDRQCHLDVSRPRVVGVYLHRIDDQRVADTVQATEECQNGRGLTRAFQLNLGELLARSARRGLPDRTELDGPGHGGLLDRRTGVRNDGGLRQ